VRNGVRHDAHCGQFLLTNVHSGIRNQIPALAGNSKKPADASVADETKLHVHVRRGTEAVATVNVTDHRRHGFDHAGVVVWHVNLLVCSVDS